MKWKSFIYDPSYSQSVLASCVEWYRLVSGEWSRKEAVAWPGEVSSWQMALWRSHLTSSWMQNGWPSATYDGVQPNRQNEHVSTPKRNLFYVHFKLTFWSAGLFRSPWQKNVIFLRIGRLDGLPILTTTKEWRVTVYTASMVPLSFLFNPELHSSAPITHFPHWLIMLLKFDSIYHVLNWGICSTGRRQGYIWTPLLTSDYNGQNDSCIV